MIIKSDLNEIKCLGNIIIQMQVKITECNRSLLELYTLVNNRYLQKQSV